MCKHKRIHIWVTVPQLSPCKTHFAKWDTCGVSDPLIDNDVQLMPFHTDIHCWLVNRSICHAPGTGLWGEFIFAMNRFHRFFPLPPTHPSDIFAIISFQWWWFLKSVLCFNEGLNLKHILGELASCIKEHYWHYTGGATDCGLCCHIKPCCFSHMREGFTLTQFHLPSSWWLC